MAPTARVTTPSVLLAPTVMTALCGSTATIAVGMRAASVGHTRVVRTGRLAALGAASPFPIQAATIPDVLKGKDVLGRGKTGSGKTIAFGAPLVERLMENGGAKGRKPGRRPRALILAPTRELALQTLVVLPVLYYLVEGAKERRVDRRAAKAVIPAV